MRIHIRNGKDGFWAEVEGVPGCVAQGKTEKEVKQRINRAIASTAANKRCPTVFADETPVYLLDWPKAWMRISN